MSNPFFRFKQFTVFQGKCAMKVGIDGVLLGAWTDVSDVNHILDIGIGTGLITLMLAQRCKAVITGIDIDLQAIEQAKENVGISPWSNRIKVLQKSVQEFSEITNIKFDLIVSNPPYFINSLKNPSESRTTARHTVSLTHEELILSSKKLLTKAGRICLILPVNEGLQCADFAEKNGLFISKLVRVKPTPTSISKRLLLEFRNEIADKNESEIIIESGIRHEYSTEFSGLVSDFYLKL